ncbi:MAG: hypothetical protein K2M14_06430 [Muribaculaceae bacterium]|nr:hypothetical protein [Muribaculaceae bacterium]
MVRDEESEHEKMIKRLKDAEEAHAKARTDSVNAINAEIRKIKILEQVAKNENEAKNIRLAAIKQLNQICPEYNAHLDGERGRLIANTDALNKYNRSLEQRMRLAYYKDEYAKYVQEDEAAKSRQRKAQKQWEQHQFDEVWDDRRYSAPNTLWGLRIPGHHTEGKVVKVPRYQDKNDKMAMELKTANEEAQITARRLAEFTADLESSGFKVTDVLGEETAVAVPSATTHMKSMAAATSTVVDQIRELKQELKSLRKMDPQTDEEFARIEARKAAIQNRLRALTGKAGNGKHRKGTGIYAEDSIDEATAAADDLHQKNLLDINKRKADISEADYLIEKNQELIRYCGDLLKALDDLRSKTDATHTQTLDKIQAEENKIAQQMETARQDINKATAQKEQEAHEKRLEAHKVFYEAQEQLLREQVYKQELTQEAADVYLLAQQKGMHQAQLNELKDYYMKVEQADYLGAEEKRNRLEKLNADIRAMQSQLLTDTGKLSELVREAMTDTTSLTGITNSYDLQKKGIESWYDALIQKAGVSGDELVALENEKQRRIAALNNKLLHRLCPHFRSIKPGAVRF